MERAATLRSPLLPHMAGFIDGQWIHAQSRRTLPVINPATGEQLAEIPDMGEVETKLAIASTEHTLANLPSLEERQRWLNAIADAMLQNRDELARIITLELGKPLREAGVEVEYAAGFFRFFATHIDHLKPRNVGETIRGARWTVHHRPAGVVGVITPWNFPLAMLAKKLPGAVAAGCSVVIKPAEITPLSAIALVHLCAQAGVPAGRVNLVLESVEWTRRWIAASGTVPA
jgi:succinate-semialdehyde dehydrogenase/glutarate-semialdehyde dehydrogenase